MSKKTDKLTPEEKKIRYDAAMAKLQEKHDKKIVKLAEKKARLTAKLKEKYAEDPEKLELELGILTIALVTKPFDYEGRPKMIVAEEGIEKLSKEADVLIVIPNEKAFSFLPANTPMIKVVQIPDGVLSG